MTEHAVERGALQEIVETLPLGRDTLLSKREGKF
jgi:hypothetical protein